MDKRNRQEGRGRVPDGARHSMATGLITIIVIVLIAWCLCVFAYYQTVDEHTPLFFIVSGSGILLCLGMIVFALRHWEDPHWVARPIKKEQRAAVIKWTCGILGSLILIMATGWEILMSSACWNSQHIPGTIIGKVGEGHGRSASVALMVKFTTPDGKEMKVKCIGSPIEFSFLLPSSGDKVDVLYNPLDPPNVFINQFWALHSFSIYCGLMGGLMLWAAWKASQKNS